MAPSRIHARGHQESFGGAAGQRSFDAATDPLRPRPLSNTGRSCFFLILTREDAEWVWHKIMSAVVTCRSQRGTGLHALTQHDP
jgi:hypothetical protein